LEATLARTDVAGRLDQQERCAKQAEAVVRMLPLPEQRAMAPSFDLQTSYFESHHNPQLGRCFLLMRLASPEQRSITVKVLDAFELRQVASFYMSGSVNDVMCGVTLPTGETKPCRTEAEFVTLTDVYMEQSGSSVEQRGSSTPGSPTQSGRR
jgi:hypothetical protein